jgi:hypothetical protein
MDGNWHSIDFPLPVETTSKSKTCCLEGDRDARRLGRLAR